MLLTPIDPHALPETLAAFRQAIAGRSLARAAFERIASTWTGEADLNLSTDARHHAQALTLCRSFGFGLINVDSHDYFTWDGRAVATKVEPSLLLHEIGHYQSAAPRRRGVIDFGLGAGPETGRKQEADAVRSVAGLQADIEEGMASLLGILWEAELGQPAVAAFLEQNWLEGGAGQRNAGHFLKMTRLLKAHGLIDDTGKPTRALRHQADAEFMAAWPQYC